MQTKKWFQKTKIKKNKVNKYGAVRSNGFASKLENAVFLILQQMEKDGEIKDLRCQHPVELTLSKIRTKVDFSYTGCIDGRQYFVEAKGIETERWKIIKKLWKFYGSATLIIYKGNFRYPKIDEIIEPQP